MTPIQWIRLILDAPSVVPEGMDLDVLRELSDDELARLLAKLSHTGTAIATLHVEVEDELKRRKALLA